MTSSQEKKREGDWLTTLFKNLEINKEFLNIGPKSNYLGWTCLSWAVTLRNKNLSFSSFKSREKRENVTLVPFNTFVSLKGQGAQ